MDGYNSTTPRADAENLDEVEGRSTAHILLSSRQGSSRPGSGKGGRSRRTLRLRTEPVTDALCDLFLPASSAPHFHLAFCGCDGYTYPFPYPLRGKVGLVRRRKSARRPKWRFAGAWILLFSSTRIGLR